MRIIAITVDAHGKATVTGSAGYVNEAGATRLSFAFDETWENLIKRVIFKAPSHTTLAPIPLPENNSITIPQSALDRDGTLRVQVTATSEDKIVKSSIFELTVDKSLSDSGQAPSPDQQDIFANLTLRMIDAEETISTAVSEVSEAVDTVNTIKQAYDNGELKGDKGADGLSPYELAVDLGYTGTEATFNAGLLLTGKLQYVEELPDEPDEDTFYLEG